LLFSIALAVGLSPELLPAILSVSLARAAEHMAKRGVLVRRLNAIENLGSMDVLCTDKTGTLTEGVVQLEGAYDPMGQHSDAVLMLGATNAALETGLPSPLDDAIVSACSAPALPVKKLAEIPFDFMRKRVSVIVQAEKQGQLIMKGAFNHVLSVCDQLPGGVLLDATRRAELEHLYAEWSNCGMRVLAIAERAVTLRDTYDRSCEVGLVFSGFLVFSDRPKAGAKEAIAALAERGVAVKLITGDNQLVARHVASLVGFRSVNLLTGAALDELHDEALWREAERTDVFAEVDPNQKERIILSLKKMGHVVGFLGDGVNDAPAMHAADTSLSVESAVDVAREAADFVLMASDLDVIRRGIDEGRKTFANTLKYVLTTTSANLGNMVSMAVASLFLPFLPLLAGQILLNNFLSDIPALGIVDDNVDAELVAKPRRWSMRFIAKFMVEFGLLSTAFDFVTFGVLLRVFHASPALFRTGWFEASLLTELAVALVVRTRRPFFRSRPGRVLLVATLALIPITYAIPWLPFANALGFVVVPVPVMVAITLTTLLYVIAAELTKRWFYQTAER
jgi:Mg2+-importing ATPase